LEYKHSWGTSIFFVQDFVICSTLLFYVTIVYFKISNISLICGYIGNINKKIQFKSECPIWLGLKELKGWIYNFRYNYWTLYSWLHDSTIIRKKWKWNFLGTQVKHVYGWDPDWSARLFKFQRNATQGMVENAKTKKVSSKERKVP
jgi:hypothetical protein